MANEQVNTIAKMGNNGDMPIQISVLGPSTWGKTAFITSARAGLSKIMPSDYKCDYSHWAAIHDKWNLTRGKQDPTSGTTVYGFNITGRRTEKRVIIMDYRGAITFSRTADESHQTIVEQRGLSCWVESSDLVIILFDDRVITKNPLNDLGTVEEYLDEVLEIYCERGTKNTALVMTHIDEVGNADEIFGLARGVAIKKGIRREMIFQSNNKKWKGAMTPPSILISALQECELIE